tara:strand:- start:1138 stop:1515 length:378 start_codon:yes stop_codon:yes gene_type:complete
MAERFETESTKLASANSVTDVYTPANTDSSDDRSVVLSVMAANTDGTNSVDVSLFVTATGSTSTTVSTVEGESTSYYLAKTITIPADASLEFVANKVVMDHGQKLRAYASAAGDCEITVSALEIY